MQKFTASIADLQVWAQLYMGSRVPDFVRGDYLRRWWIIPRNEKCNVYLHEMTASDPDPDFHDHPGDNTSLIISGSYIEHTIYRTVTRQAGDYVERKAIEPHRIVLEPGMRVVSLFTMGPHTHHWGFHTAEGFVPWEVYVARRDKA